MNERIKFIYGDLQRSYERKNEILLDTYGTQQDLQKYKMKFKEGKQYWFWRDDEYGNPLVFSAKVRYEKAISKWVAEVDMDTIKHLSESEFANDYSTKEVEGK